MERLTFFNEQSGGYIDCCLNPESVTITRLAGVRDRLVDGLPLAAPEMVEDELIFSGGGVTEIELELLFDTRVGNPSGPVGGDASERDRDVRDQTRPIWALSESRPRGETGQWPPPVRLLWGDWSMPVVVAAIAEKLEAFAPDGAPQRSWLSLRLRRGRELERRTPDFDNTPQRSQQEIDAFIEGLSEDDLVEVPVFGDQHGDEAGGPQALRPDLLAHAFLEDPRDWRIIALLSGLIDPLKPPPDGRIAAPAKGGGGA